MTTDPSSHYPLRSFSATVLLALAASYEARSAQNEEGGSRPVEIGPCGEIVIESEQRTMAERKQPVHVHALWDSRYVTEGRDNLDGNSMSSASTDVTFCNFTFAPWLAHSDGADYSEANLNLVYSRQLNKVVALYFGFTHLRFYTRARDSHDNEASFRSSYSLSNQTDFTGTAYYSFNTRGTFINLAAEHEASLSSDTTVTFSTGAGFNADYINSGHNGLNHVLLRINATYNVTQSIDLIAHASYSHAINEQPDLYTGDTRLRDTFWAGAGIVIRL